MQILLLWLSFSEVNLDRRLGLSLNYILLVKRRKGRGLPYFEVALQNLQIALSLNPVFKNGRFSHNSYNPASGLDYLRPFWQEVKSISLCLDAK